MDTKSTSIIGLVILLVFVLGGALWYMSEHPAPVSFPHGTTGLATSTEATLPKTIEEHARYYDVTAKTPSNTSIRSTAGIEADAKATEVMKQFVLTQIEAFKERGNFNNLSAEDIKMMGFNDGRKEAFDISYSVKAGTQTVSYVFTLFEDTFGAHPNTYLRTFTFDKKTGAGLELDDVFASNVDYLSLLSRKSRELLPAQLAKKADTSVKEIDMKMIQDGTTPDPDNFTNWYIQDGNLVLVFPTYQVAAYVFGPQEVSLPLSSLSGVRKEYK